MKPITSTCTSRSLWPMRRYGAGFWKFQTLIETSGCCHRHYTHRRQLLCHCQKPSDSSSTCSLYKAVKDVSPTDPPTSKTGASTVGSKLFKAERDTQPLTRRCQTWGASLISSRYIWLVCTACSHLLTCWIHSATANCLVLVSFSRQFCRESRPKLPEPKPHTK